MTPVDALIVSFRTGDLAREAAQSVSGPGVRVLVHDNSGELLADPPPGVELHGDGTNLLYAEANNRLFAASSAPLVLLLNPDVELAHGELERLVAALEADPAAWGAVPQLRHPDGSLQRYVRRLPTLRALLADRLPPLRLVLRRDYERHYCRDVDLTRSGTVEQPAAACLLLRRDRLGGRLFDPSYPLFFNDTDLARRLRAAGHCLYVAQVRATHHGGASIARARGRHRSWIRRQYDDSLLRYARRHLRGWPLLVPVVLLRRLAARHPVPPSGPA